MTSSHIVRNVGKPMPEHTCGQPEHDEVTDYLLLRMVNSREGLINLMGEAEAFFHERGLDERTIYISNLVLEEVLTNVIKYAYDDEGSHEISVELTLDPRDVQIVFEDDGCEFNPLSVPTPALNGPITDCEPGGLGIHLVRKLSSSMDYSRTGGVNRLTIRLARQ